MTSCILEDDEVLEVGELRVRTTPHPRAHPGIDLLRDRRCTAYLLRATRLLSRRGRRNTKSALEANFPSIITSIERRLFATLPPETIVLPGHGLDTTIGAERPHLDEWVERGW